MAVFTTESTEDTEGERRGDVVYNGDSNGSKGQE